MMTRLRKVSLVVKNSQIHKGQMWSSHSNTLLSGQAATQRINNCVFMCLLMCACGGGLYSKKFCFRGHEVGLETLFSSESQEIPTGSQV